MKLINLFKRKSKVKEIQNGIIMDNIQEAIFNYLEMKTTGALLLTGEWGSGKTYYIKNKIFPIIEDRTSFIPIIVSLFGETDKNNIAQKVLFAYFDKKGENVHLSTGALAKNLKNLNEAIPIVKKYVDVNKLIIGTGDNVFKFLPHEKLLICFDDIERKSENIDVNDFLGTINELVENRGAKVLLIANEQELKHDITFKEKTIDKTIYYLPAVSLIYDDIIKIYSESKFYKYLKEKKDELLNVLDVENAQGEYKEELQKSFSNIRTLKFAIEHFKYAYSIIIKQDNLENEIIEKQLKNLWVFVLAISAEFKKPNNISFVERKNLDKQSNSIPKVILKDLGIDNEENNVEDVWTFSNKFKEKYYERVSETYVFYNDMYNLITSGKNIEETVFLGQLKASFNLSEGKINPAHALLNQFIRDGYWIFKNEEFEEKLNELLGYTEEGKFEGITSYLNAGVYLFSFIDFIDSTEDEVLSKIKKGIDKFFINTKIDRSIKTQLDMVSQSFNESPLKDLKSYTIDKILEAEKKQEKEEALKLQKSFIETPNG